MEPTAEHGSRPGDAERRWTARVSFFVENKFVVFVARTGVPGPSQSFSTFENEPGAYPGFADRNSACT